MRKRANFERALADWSVAGGQKYVSRVLLDAGWDNPNYWFRLSLVRKAMGFAESDETALLGPTRKPQLAKRSENLSFDRIVDWMPEEPSSESLRKAAQLWESVGAAEDILNLELPGEFPAATLYDFILKRQKKCSVDPSPELCVKHVARFIDLISRSDELLRSHDPDLVLASHAISYYAPLVWSAMRLGIPTVVLHGAFGDLRFWKAKANLHDWLDRPKFGDLGKLTDAHRSTLARLGETIISNRMNGHASDLGGALAFRSGRETDRTRICKEYGWSVHRPIITVYGSNWFDFPHMLGMSRFRDFLDWIQSVYRVATSCDRVNWLFKPHPCESWYGGPSLTEICGSDAPGHVRMVSPEWDSLSLIRTVDAVLTYHGAVGIEASAIGTPTLLPDVGNYHDWGFARMAGSRSEYLDLLETEWWVDMDTHENARLAKLFAGWYWGRPPWQGGALLPDDTSLRDAYRAVPRLLRHPDDRLARELSTVRSWFESDQSHYHTYLMSREEDFGDRPRSDTPSSQDKERHAPA